MDDQRAGNFPSGVLRRPRPGELVRHRGRSRPACTGIADAKDPPRSISISTGTQGHATGTSEGKPIDLSLEPDTQDLNSIQIQVMLDLKNDNLPPTFHVIDKDQVKGFLYTREGTAQLKTAIGTYHTVIVASRHTANDRRVLRMWFAPALGWVPVQAERTSSGKLEFAMRIRSLTHEGERLTAPP
jgi:hypothetical protein